VKNGIPFDVAFSAELDWVMAAGVVFGEFEGGKFDWQRMQWADRR
jgi:hypothetical protein